MSKYEFLSKLREALLTEFPSQVVEGHIRYYDQYITDAVMDGREENAVMEELGDPWMIAHTIIDTSSQERREEFIYDAVGQEAGSRGRKHSYVKKEQWKWVLTVFAIVLLLLAVISIVSGLVIALVPILVPLVLVMSFIRILRRRN